MARQLLGMAVLVVLVAQLAGADWTVAEDAGAPTLDALLAGERVTIAFDELRKRAVLAPHQSFRAVEVGRDEHTSHHVVSIRHREVPHRHDRHDLLVVMLAGHGTMRIGDEVRSVAPRSILYVPRGAVHAFTNQSGEPAVAYAVYTPGFDGKDRVPAP